MAKKSNTTPIIIGLLAAGAIDYYLYYKNTADTVNGVNTKNTQITENIKKLRSYADSMSDFYNSQTNSKRDKEIGKDYQNKCENLIEEIENITPNSY